MTILVFLSSLLGAMALGMPIAYALLVCGVALMLQLDMFDAQIIAQNIINGADSFPLMAVPFFMLAGEIMNTGGLSKRIVNLALALIGHVRGGLGYVAIIAACILSALSGSAVADAAALSALLVPMMVKAGHDKASSGGLIAASGIIGPVIPPSIGFIVFGVASGLSISKLFLAGIFPGLMLGVGLAVAWWWVARKETLVMPPQADRARERLRAFIDSLWALGLPFIIIFGLKFGIFTPTEAGVVAAVYSLFVATVSLPRAEGSRPLPGVPDRRQGDRRRDVPGRGLAGLGLADHGRRPAGPGHRAARAADGQPDAAADRDHAAGGGGRHRHGHDADHPDPDPGADAGGQGGGHRSDLFRRAVHHQQLDRPDHAAGRHRAQRGRRAWRGSAWRT